MAEEKKTARLKIRNVRVPAEDSPDIAGCLSSRFHVYPECIRNISVLKRSLDKRQKKHYYVYTLLVVIHAESIRIDSLLQQPDIEMHEHEVRSVHYRCRGRVSKRPVIIGCGPAGLFAAAALVRRGISPLVIERGERIGDRVATVNEFWRRGVLNPESNVCYGEGGAGTFSDGKLTTRIKSPLKHEVLETLVKAGADDAIIYTHRPHLGTDMLRKIMPRIVDGLAGAGAEFRFNTAVTDIDVRNGKVVGVRTGNAYTSTNHVFLATGLSAREIYRLLSRKGVMLEKKGFAVGLRIEHPRIVIDGRGRHAHTREGADGGEEYVLTFKQKESRRGVYTFCMCPGGSVIACTSSEGELCTNGMSYSPRSGRWSNAAVVVTVCPEDIHGNDALNGIVFQQDLERKAFVMGGSGYGAPVQPAADFISARQQLPTRYDHRSSYTPEVKAADLRHLFPEHLYTALCSSLRAFDKKIPGFIREGLLLGVETRTSSPVRIVRNATTFHSTTIQGLIPVGEGSGYAGGIVSSAVDGMKAALQFDL